MTGDPESLPEPGLHRPSVLTAGAWAWMLLLFGICVSIAMPFVVADAYGAALTWPALATAFSATFLAFVVALGWDRYQRRLADLREAAAHARQEVAQRRAEHERRVLEAKRRFAAIALELERIEASLRRTVEEQHRFKYFFPDLPTGSWNASGGPLGLIVADYGLMADLATFYGQVEELRWRLRFKAYGSVEDAGIAPLVEGLARELLGVVAELRSDVGKQRQAPDVETVALEQAAARIAGRRQVTAAIRISDLLPGRGPGPAGPSDG